jgi:dTDP-glucose pyrophosphorylase
MKFGDLMIQDAATLRETLQRIDAGGIQLALVVDGDGRLLGTVSDGDVRRGLLRGLTLESRVTECMNREPTSVPAGTSNREILQRLKRSHLHQMPVVDAAGRIVDLKVLDELIDQPERPNTVVLMVGGRGERLGDLTRNLPKPMLPVGGRPLLETIIGALCDQGFRRIRLAVNFMSDVIERHFGDGSRFDCDIQYLREQQRMGTAGALSLLGEVPDEPVLVSNGDLLLRLDYGSLLDHHVATGAEATMAVREFDYQVPYGVVRTQGEQIVSLEEKPVQRYLISGGLYVLSPSAVRRVPANTFYDMPSLFDDVVRAGGRASIFRIDGYWLDIGRFADYEQAQREFNSVFKPE